MYNDVFTKDVNYILKTPLQWFTYYNFYSQKNKDNKPESWQEAVTRATESLRYLSNNKLEEEDYKEIAQYIYELKVVPSMRLFSMPLDAIKRCNSVIYNCSFIAIDNFDAIAEMLYLSMSGVGIGYTVEHKAIDKLPVLPDFLFGDDEVFVIPDTQTGWADSVKHLFKSVENGIYPQFDYSQIRPAGAPLKTKGGVASGPEPLKTYHKHVMRIIEHALGRQLTSIELHDIVNMVSECAISNGSRTGALICLFDDNDTDMLNAKSDPKWATKYKWRSYSNNSIVVNGTTDQVIDEVVQRLIYDASGEPGLFSPKKFYEVGRVSHDGYVGVNPCLTGDTLVHTINGDIRFDELAKTENDVDVYCVNQNGELTIRTMHRPHKTGEKPVYEIEIEGGFKVKATVNHKFLTTNNEYVAVEDLKPGDSIVYFVEYDQPNKKGSQNYRWYNSSFRPQRYSMHRVIAEHYYNNDIKLDDDMVVHHIDYCGKNNSINNLKLMSKVDHDILHRENMLGDNNPMRRAQHEWSDRKWNKYRSAMSKSTSGERNGKYSGYTHKQLYEICKIETAKKGSKLTINEWRELANQYPNLPKNFSKFRKEELGSVPEFLHQVNTDVHGVQVYSNHKIVSINYVGVEPVYNGMVDEYHNYLIGSWDEPIGKRKQENRKLYIVSKNCGEVLLRNKQFCNLSTVILDEETVTNSEELLNRLRVATLIGTIQSMADHFDYLSDTWQFNTQEERLLGVSITGIYDYKDYFNAGKLDVMKRFVEAMNESYARDLGINPSTSTTSIKPSGNTSVLTNTSPGVNPDFGRYQIRNIRVGKNTPMARFLLEKGVPYFNDPNQTNDSRYIFMFPFEGHSNDTLETTNLEQQLENHMVWANYYTTHNPSVTITYQPEEKDALAQWIRDNYQHVTGMAFWQAYDQTQSYLPVQVVTEQQFKELMDIYPDIDWTEYPDFVGSKHITAKILECSGERCDVVFG